MIGDYVRAALRLLPLLVVVALFVPGAAASVIAATEAALTQVTAWWPSDPLLAFLPILGGAFVGTIISAIASSRTNAAGTTYCLTDDGRVEEK